MMDALELLLRYIEDEWADTDAPILLLARGVRKEIGRPKDRFAELERILQDMGTLAESYRRNRVPLIEALQAKGIPSNWLSSWEIKFERAERLLKGEK